MDEIQIVMYVGFLLAAYSVIGNDVIQTLGTFLSSNEKRHWTVLWLFAGSILTIVLVYGWFVNNGDVSYGRLIGDEGLSNPKYKAPADIKSFGWPFLLPPIILLIITRFGIPVSTSFLILTFFNPKNLDSMLVKSISGYALALVVAFIFYIITARWLEKRFLDQRISDRNRILWTIGQWLSTGFLWGQWLVQDFANIYVYLPRQISWQTLVVTVFVFLALLAYIFYSKGGAIQSIVRSKTNTTDIRSATLIDLCYGLILLYFKELSNVPMSTTWVFIGILAGRELAIRWRLNKTVSKSAFKDLGYDLLKVSFGLVVSIALVFIINNVAGTILRLGGQIQLS